MSSYDFLKVGYLICTKEMADRTYGFFLEKLNVSGDPKHWYITNFYPLKKKNFVGIVVEIIKNTDENFNICKVFHGNEYVYIYAHTVDYYRENK